MKYLAPLYIILALLLAGCGAQAFVPGLGQNTAVPAPTEAPTITASPTLLPSPTAPATWTVCTGLPNGNLNVRACAGVGCAATTTLSEGMQIAASGEPDAGWLEVSIPVSGWVSADYLCASKLVSKKGK